MSRPKPAFRPKLDDLLKAGPGPKAPPAPPAPLPGLDADLDPDIVASVMADLNRQPRRRTPADPRGAVPGARDPPEDPAGAEDRDAADLLAVMSGRLRTLEKELADHREALRHKDCRIRDLKAELGEERRRLGSGAGDQVRELTEENAVLRIQNTRLMQQLLQYKRALQSHGLKPPEDPDRDRLDAFMDDASDASARSRQSSPETRRSSASNPDPRAPRRPSPFFANDDTPFDYAKCVPSPAEGARGEGGYGGRARPSPGAGAGAPAPKLPFDFAKLCKNVKDLNYHSGPEHEVVRTAGGDNIVRFNARKAVPIVFYSNGLVMNDGFFRPYHWPAGQAVVQDLVDGYFPYELKDKHPDGVPLEVIDKTTEACPKPAKQEAKAVEGLEGLQDHGYKVISKDNFLKRLPKNVVKNGQLVPVRDDIGALLQPPPPDGGAPGAVERTVLETTAYAQRGRGEAGPQASPAPASERDITTIQVKGPASKSSREMRVFIVHLFYDQTVGDLRKQVRNQLGTQPLDAFNLCTVFPNTTYTDDSSTMQDVGLVPTATVHVRWL